VRPRLEHTDIDPDHAALGDAAEPPRVAFAEADATALAERSRQPHVDRAVAGERRQATADELGACRAARGGARERDHDLKFLGIGMQPQQIGGDEIRDPRSKARVHQHGATGASRHRAQRPAGRGRKRRGVDQ